MLVTPDNKVEEVRKETLRNVAGWSSLGSVLVEYKDVEPGGRILGRSFKLNLH